MYSELYLRLEPLGLELVAEAARQAGHSVRLLDLQVFRHRHLFAILERWRPDAVGFSLNYLANVPEVIDLALEVRGRLEHCFVFVGGHSASFVAEEVIRHARGAIDCVVRGEGEEITPRLLAMVEAGEPAITLLPGVVTAQSEGPCPELVADLDCIRPQHRLLPRRRRYFIGTLDPCASVELARGCPWDCSFCSAWTFYGRSYRKSSPEVAAEEIASIREPGIFIVDDVAFIDGDHGYAVGREIERRGLRKRYYLETRTDVLLRNSEVFRYWSRLGLSYMFLGLEAIDDAQLKAHRKRVSLGKSLEALEFARSLDVAVAVNIIADPAWDEGCFAAIREWATSVPEIVHLTVNTPYPGTETWLTNGGKLITRDYRLFDVQHAVLPTRLPLKRFYEELVTTQQVLNRKHLGFRALWKTFTLTMGLLARGQTNFLRMLWKFDQVYNAKRQFADHRRPIRYEIDLPPERAVGLDARSLYVHRPPSGTASASA